MQRFRTIPKWVLICFVISPLVMTGGNFLAIYDVPYAAWVAQVAFAVTSVALVAVLFFDADPFG